MAGKISAKGAVITITDAAAVQRTISSDCDSFEIKQDAGKVEVTGFGDGSKNYIPGLPVYEVVLDVIWNSTASTGAKVVLLGIFGKATPCTLTICPEVGGQTLTFPCMMDNFPVKGTPAGKLEIGSVTFSAMGATAGSWA